MPKKASIDQAVVLAKAIHKAGAAGLSPLDLVGLAPSRSTLNRRLAELVREGSIKELGAGRATRYVSTSPLLKQDIELYFARPWQERPYAPYREEWLQPLPGLDLDLAERCTHIQAVVPKIDRRFFARFIIDFSWGSSVLEGGTYTELDTQALVEYGQRNPDKPTEDALLVLNHKLAAEYLWGHLDLSMEQACAVHAFLTDNHGLLGVADSDHFLPNAQRGKAREFEEIHLGQSAYSPPFRPGTGYVAQALGVILSTARGLHPVQAAMYLMTRIPYLQAFANGNKRTARLLANAPLLQAGIMPLSFADMDKADYIRAMSAFYELGDVTLIEQVFLRGYVKAIIRSSQIPPDLRATGFDTNAVCQALLAYIRTGQIPLLKAAALFIDKVTARAR